MFETKDMSEMSRTLLLTIPTAVFTIVYDLLTSGSALFMSFDWMSDLEV